MAKKKILNRTDTPEKEFNKFLQLRGVLDIHLGEHQWDKAIKTIEKIKKLEVDVSDK